MLYLNLSGHDLILKKRFGISPEKTLPNQQSLTAFFKESYKTDKIEETQSYFLLFLFFDTNQGG